MSYKCNYCNSIFDEPNYKEITSNEDYGERTVERVTYESTCPECGSEDYSEYWEDNHDE